MADGFDVGALNRLAFTLNGAGAAVAVAASTAVRKTAHDVEATAKALAPVDTGNLRNSIGTDIRVGLGYTEAEIGPTASYGVFVEFGTARMAPQAYMGPALDRHGYQLEQALGELAGGLL